MRIACGAFSLLAAAAICAAPAPGQSAIEPSHRIDLTVEMKDGDSARVMDPLHIFAPGDLIRFRLRSTVNGFLYVVNQGSSTKFEQLFPHDDSLQSRQLIAEKTHLIPASATGWFMIKDPPGYETVYFLISPADLGPSLPAVKYPADTTATPQGSADSSALATSTPRCNDELFRSRGECLDSDAGVKPIHKGESLPTRIPAVSGNAERDLVVVKDSKDTSISSTQPLDALSVYRIKISHK